MNVKVIVMTALAFWGGSVAAQHREIEFDKLSMAEAREKAAAEQKLIFIDCYTTWCIPCKHMEANVFTVDSVADYFNKTFINLKMDMDKGEAKDLGKVYEVGAFPSYLLVDKEGKLVYKFVGGMSAPEFMAKIKTGLHGDNDVAVMNQRYASGDRSPAFLREYILLKIRLMEIEPAKQLNEELMQQLSPAEKAKKENWVLFGENRYDLYLSDARCTNFTYLAEHWKDFTAEVSADTVNHKLSTVYRKIAGVFVGGGFRGETNGKRYVPADIPLYKKQIEATEMPDKAQMLVLMDLSQAAADKDINKMTLLLQQHVDEFSQANQSIVFDYIFGSLSIPGYTYDGFSVIADKVAKTSKNPYLINICEEYKQREAKAHGK